LIVTLDSWVMVFVLLEKKVECMLKSFLFRKKWKLIYRYRYENKFNYLNQQLIFNLLVLPDSRIRLKLNPFAYRPAFACVPQVENPNIRLQLKNCLKLYLVQWTKIHVSCLNDFIHVITWHFKYVLSAIKMWYSMNVFLITSRYFNDSWNLR